MDQEYKFEGVNFFWMLWLAEPQYSREFILQRVSSFNFKPIQM
jgi:hypothetical protein